MLRAEVLHKEAGSPSLGSLRLRINRVEIIPKAEVKCVCGSCHGMHVESMWRQSVESHLLIIQRLMLAEIL